MKLIALWSHLKQHYRTLNESNDVFRLLFPSFLVFLSAASVILFFAQYVTVAGFSPFASIMTRAECVLVLFLVWVMKALLIDFTHPLFTWKVSDKTKRQWRLLEAHLTGVKRFLQATFFRDHGKQRRLSSLPWMVLIGPHKAGKTTLFAKSSTRYILQKKSANGEGQSNSLVDFWATRHAIFAEVRGDALGFSMLHDGRQPERAEHDSTWRYFLNWLKQTKRTSPIRGVFLVVPYTIFTLSEKMQRHAAKRLMERVSAFAELQQRRLPLYIVVTQCDRMSGFAPFFHGLAQEETEQLFGVQLSYDSQAETPVSQVKSQFERLIKQLNQQLIHKLHREPSAAIKPFIKEFPLQLEQLKRNICELTKRLEPAFHYVQLEGIFLTSAQQERQQTTLSGDSEEATTTGLQLYSETHFTSRPYFVKSLFAQLPLELQKTSKKIVLKWHQKIRLQYALPALFVLMMSGVFAVDFLHGVTIERSVKRALVQYQTQSSTPALFQETLSRTLGMLDALQQIQKTNATKATQLSFAFYTDRALMHAEASYFKAIEQFLLPILHKQLGLALLQSNNYEPQTAYSMLKAYLMLTGHVEREPAYFYYALLGVEPFHSQKVIANKLAPHLAFVFKSRDKSMLPVDERLVQTARQHLWYLSKERLAYIILFNQNHYFLPITLPWTEDNHALLRTDHDFFIPSLFSAKNITTILTKDVLQVTKEAHLGNDVLGFQRDAVFQDQDALLNSTVRNIYIQAYANYWERLLSRVTVQPTHDLSEWEQNIVLFNRTDSMFYQLLQLVYDNTYFEPIASINPHLRAFAHLLDKSDPSSLQLSTIQQGLENVYHYVQPVLVSPDQAKAAFLLTSKRMQEQRVVDPITQLRLVAEKSPEPIKAWLQDVADQLWSHLMHQASQYMNLAWQDKIGQFYDAHFLNRYPFDSASKEDVSLVAFKSFFASSGHFVQFYRDYLDAFIDYEDKVWRWKMLDAKRLPFSDEVLKQIQLGLRIHDAFFPNGDDQLSLNFNLAATQWGGDLQKVMININDQQLVDYAGKKQKHLIQWPGQSANNISSVQFTLNNQRMFTRQYVGVWSLFRLVDDTFDTMVSKNELILDLSSDDYPAKYVVSTKEPVNPFSTVKLSYFRLPERLI